MRSGCELATSVEVFERHQRRLDVRVDGAADHDRSRLGTDDETSLAPNSLHVALDDGYYDCWCYLPLLAFLTWSTTKSSRNQLSRPCCGPAPRRRTQGAVGVVLCRLLEALLRERLAELFPRRAFLQRLDGGYLRQAEIFDWLLDAEPGLDYVVANGELTRCWCGTPTRAM